MNTVPKNARCRRTAAERAAYRRRLTRVSPEAAKAKIGPEDYRLFTRFHVVVDRIRAEECKSPEQQNKAKLALYRSRAAEIADKLYQRHCRLVYAAVKQYLGHLTSTRTSHQENSSQVNAALSWDDLVQEGCIGLMKAFEEFVPRAGNRFSTYAIPWIYQAITRPVMMSVEVPSYINPMLKQIKQARERIAKTLDRQPTDKELLQATGLSQQRFRLALLAERRAVGRVSLDALNTGNASLPTVDQTDPAAKLDQKELTNTIAQAFRVAGLTKRDREVLDARFGLNGNEPLKLEAIGKRFGITRERVRQIENKAIKKLVSGPAAEILKPYQYLIA